MSIVYVYCLLSYVYCLLSTVYNILSTVYNLLSTDWHCPVLTLIVWPSLEHCLLILTSLVKTKFINSWTTVVIEQPLGGFAGTSKNCWQHLPWPLHPDQTPVSPGLPTFLAVFAPALHFLDTSAFHIIISRPWRSQGLLYK